MALSIWARNDGVFSTKRDCLILCGLFVVLAAIHITVGPLIWTGDEPRYTYQGLGLYTRHAFYPTQAVWDRFLQTNDFSLKTHPYLGEVLHPFNSLSPSVVYGGLLLTAGLEAARWLNFLIGCAGIAALYLLLKRAFVKKLGLADWPVAVSVFIVALSLPLLPYLKLLYPEVLLFTIVALALWSLLAGKPYLTLALVTLLPFVHIRVLLLTVTFLAILIFDVRNRGATRAAVRRLALLCVLGLAIFGAAYYALFGSFATGTAGAFAVYPPSLALFPERLGMQLYDVRHGVLAYSPMFLLGFAGLTLGMIRRDRACSYSALLLVSYVLVFMWSTGGEAWTARFWVAALPFLAVGMCYWLYACSGKQWPISIFPLAIVNILNVIAFVYQPNWFLYDRRTSIPYAQWFFVSHVHLGRLLPVDADPGRLPPYTAPIPVLLGFTAVAVLLLVLCNGLRSPQQQRYARILTFALFLSPFLICAGSTIPPTRYSVAAVTGAQGLRIKMLPGQTGVSAVQFDSKLEVNWVTPAFPSEFLITCFKESQLLNAGIEPARPLVTLPRCRQATEIDVQSTPANNGAAFYKDAGHVTLIRSIL